MEKQYCVYIMTNQRNTVLYTEVTNDLKRRVMEHKNKATKGFTSRYNIDKLVYFEVHSPFSGWSRNDNPLKRSIP